MAFQITDTGGVYEIKGLLNSQNYVYLENHLTHVLTISRGVVLSLEKVHSIDKYAVRRMVMLQNKIQPTQKMFFIIGRKNKKVSKQFSQLQLEEILL
ncbi:hypothetical protein SLW70_05095 [Flavobacterium sp. NG2]|uniref:hypothetical protein n=1 Tax=Flavobacterium sp. NG2 TaxID=3097547 RepID=UPI002A806E88|nr:hypothetical protein [Flavobacterium sp. NG2]WPR72517.1 hypothetical protein SLW70_05095 [Flavobacterium sp. NG2]